MSGKSFLSIKSIQNILTSGKFLGVLIVIFLILLVFNYQQEKSNSEKIKKIEEKIVTEQKIVKQQQKEEQEVATGNNYFVSATGSDSNDGLSSQTPFKSIQKALEFAFPGDNVILAPGVYYQDVISVRQGEEAKPIIIKGDSSVVVKGAGKSRIFEINHSFINLEGFTIDGLWGNPDSSNGYRDKLIYILGKQGGITGIKISGMTLKNAGGECVRVRYFATNNEVAYNNIGPCGVQDFKFESDNKNGEGVYIGTAPDQWGDGKNPTSGPDISVSNYVHHNIINTQGNECVDIKEGSLKNLVEYNSCTGQKDKESGGFDARGDNNIFRNNITFGNVGAGVRLGGHTVDGVNYGINNDVYDNVFKDNNAGGVKIEKSPQGKICGNNMKNNNSREVFGSKSENINPSSSCLE